MQGVDNRPSKYQQEMADLENNRGRRVVDFNTPHINWDHLSVRGFEAVELLNWAKQRFLSQYGNSSTEESAVLELT